MAFEQPELSRALRELAVERDSSFASERRTYVDYDADGNVERITWPEKLGALPEPATIDAKVQVVRQRLPSPEQPQVRRRI